MTYPIPSNKDYGIVLSDEKAALTSLRLGWVYSLFFLTGLLLVLAGLKLTMWTRLALNHRDLPASASKMLKSKGAHHYAYP